MSHEPFDSELNQLILLPQLSGLEAHDRKYIAIT